MNSFNSWFEKLGADVHQIGIFLGGIVGFVCVWAAVERHRGIEAIILMVLAGWGYISMYIKYDHLKHERDEYERILREHDLHPHDNLMKRLKN
ncbi:MAG TPA: hypothetical protein VG962_03550 [Steroidobacteraceae bacterium]|nr:hypothetical protein [Steroidobacteraceae bacterium]